MLQKRKCHTVLLSHPFWNNLDKADLTKKISLFCLQKNHNKIKLNLLVFNREFEHSRSCNTMCSCWLFFTKYGKKTCQNVMVGNKTLGKTFINRKYRYEYESKWNKKPWTFQGKILRWNYYSNKNKLGMTLRKITLHFKRYKIFLVLVLRSNLIFESFPVNFTH